MRGLGINVNAVPGMGAGDFAKTVKALGFTHAMSDTSTPTEMKERAEAVLGAGLVFDQLHAPFNTINNMWLDIPEAEYTQRQLTDAIDCCVAFGAPIATVHLSSGPNPPTITDLGRARYAALVEYAAKKGITIAFENQRFLYNIAWAFHDFRDAPNVGFCWDVGHQACATPHIEFMRLFGNKLVCTHLEDNNAVFGEDLHILPFDGKADFDSASHLLKEYNYKGNLTLEVGKRPAFYESYTNEAFLQRAFDAVCRIRTMLDGE
ncbi:MAG: sugar phosphate isomerase/epimerase [Clostridia bacterium]|nr:sugar phosphate isomerase/epimerase [Clostridia bacterium]